MAMSSSLKLMQPSLVEAGFCAVVWRPDVSRHPIRRSERMVFGMAEI
jgi:hypothetical protein